jgi:hypothetical protein
MKAKNLVVVTLNLLFCVIFSSSVLAGSLSGRIRVDDEFRMYLSSSDTQQGTLIASGNQWYATYAISASLNDGQEYYLHVYGKDTGGAVGFLAEFTLAGNYHRFSNNSSRIVTNTSNWKVSTTGWGNYSNASDSGGLNGNGTAHIGSDATWLWSSSPQNDDHVYFSVKITSQSTPYGDELRGKIRVDDQSSVYLSTDDNVQGVLLGSASDWQTTHYINSALTAGQSYFLHVYGKDLQDVAAILGEFTINGNDHIFSNNQTTILTNPSNWKVSKTGWGNYVNASVVNGKNGVDPWGSNPQISSNADWIWTSDAYNDNEAYFSLEIVSQSNNATHALSGYLTGDKSIDVYVSTDDNVAGTYLGSGNNWQSTYTFRQDLTKGQNYFFHVLAQGTGGIAGFIGDFSLDGTDHVFPNNQKTISTNTTNWKVSTSGWNNYVNASMVNGNNGVSPWGTRPYISSGATWIWSSDAQNDNLVYLTLPILSNSASTPAGQCAAVFPNGASSHSGNGYINFDYNSQVLGASSNVLATSTITKNSGSTAKTCQSQNCTASGSPSDTMSVGTFVSKSSNTNVDISYQGSATVGGNSHPGDTFKTINANYASEATITFSNNHHEYFVDSLILAYKNTLYLQAGSVYWINQLVTNSELKIIVQGSGTAKIYVNQSIAFPSPGLINSPSANSSGDASKLVLFAYNDVSFNNQTTFSGSLYSKGNITLGSASYAFGAISAANITLGTDSTITYQATSVENTSYGDMCAANTVIVDHFRIEHDSQGLTCEAESVVVKACVDAACTTLYDQPTSITLAPGSWSEGNTFNFTGSTSKTVSISTAGNYTFSKTTSSVAANLRCFYAASETCDIDFVDAGFEFIGATVNDKNLLDQVAESNFNNVNLRAVRNTNGVCQSAFTGTKAVVLSYNCTSPGSCKTPLAGIPISNPAGENSGTINLTFDSNGIASLGFLNYADAGRLSLSAETTINNAQIIKGSALVDVYPSYLSVNVSPASLASTGPADTTKATAGKPFELQIGAYGAAGHLLPNYEAENMKLSVWRSLPSESGSVDGQFKYASTGFVNSSGMANIYNSTANLEFNNGLYSYSGAYYTETGRLNLDLQDSSYLGNKICTISDPACNSNDINYLTLDAFIPAYYQVEIVEPLPFLENVQNGFTYIGQTNEFERNPTFNVIAKNALGQTTLNYDSTYWKLRPNQSDVNDVNKLEYIDQSNYVGDVTFVRGGAPTLTGDNNFDGSVVMELLGATVTYKKVDANNSMFGPVNPYSANFDITLSAAFLTDSDGICFRDTYQDSTCNELTFAGITGADLRFGRFALRSTYGPENEMLRPEFAVEYYKDGQWLINTLDNETTINFSQASNQLLLSKKGAGNDLTGSFDPVTSDGQLLLGLPDDKNDFKFSAPGQPGEVYLRLNPAADPNAWPQYLNYDWNGDGKICNQVGLCVNGNGLDYPQATLSFGLFRGNDRVIQWREVFN